MLRRVQYVPERATKLIFASSQEAMVLSVGREPCVPITDSQILSAATSQPITQESDEEELQQSPRSLSSPIPRRRKALASRKKRQRDADPVTDRPTKRQQPSRRGGISSTGPTTQSADLDQIKKTSDTPYFVESEEEHERDDDAFGDDIGLSEGDRDAGAAGVDVGGAGIDLPRLRQMLEPKLRSLHPSVRAEVQAKLQKYDDDISRETAKIAAAHRAIKKKQIELVDKIGKLLEQHSQPPLSPEPSNPHSGSEESDESCTGGHTDQVQHDTRKDDNTLVHTEEVVQGDQVLNDTPLEADKIDDNCRVVSLDTSTMNPIAHLSDNVTLELETFERGVVPRKKRSEKVFVPDCDNAHHDSEKDQGDERFVNNLFNFDDAGNVPTEHSLEDVACDRQAHEITIGQAGPNIIFSNLGRTMDDNIGSLDLPGHAEKLFLEDPANQNNPIDHIIETFEKDHVYIDSVAVDADTNHSDPISSPSSIKKTILIPVIDRGHYSLYAVNFEASRVDVLDTLDYDNAGTTWLYRHGESGATVITRLNALLQKKSKGALKKFGNFRLTKFSYDVVNPEKSAELRAEYLYYLLFHPSNKAEIPEDLSRYPDHRLPILNAHCHPHDINPEIVPRVGMVFSSEEQAKLFYKRYAREAGFPMKLSRTKKSVREICCSRIGKGEYYLGDEEERQRNNTSKKSGCKAYIKLHRDRDETGAISRNDLRLSGSDGTTHSLRTTELLTEAMGVVRAAAMSSVGRDRAMDVLRELRKQLEALPPDLGPQAAPRPNLTTNCRVVSLDTSTMNPIAHLSDNVTLELETFERGVVPRKKRSEKVFVPDCDNAHHDSEKDQGDERFVNNLFNFDDAGNVPTEHSLEDVACDRQAHEITIGQYTGGFRAVQKIPYSRRNQKRSKDVDPNLLVDSGVKRTTRAPQKLSSPIKIGYMRTSPGAEVSLRLRNMLCDPHSAYKNLTLMEYTMVNIDGDCIMRSFPDFQETDNSVMEAFVNCIWDDDKNYRPELVKERLILHPQLAVCANVENCGSQHNPDAVFSEESLDTAFDLYMTNDIAWRSIKLILIPVIDRGHYSLYAVNFEASRVDVLDTLDYDNAGTTWLYRHGESGATVITRLNALLQKKSKGALKKFGNFRLTKFSCPTMEKSAELRAEYLYYLLFHPSNKAEIPEDLSPVHSSHVVSSEATKGMETPSSRVRFAAMVSNQAPDSPEYYTVPCSAPDLSPRVSPPPTTAAPGLTRQDEDSSIAAALRIVYPRTEHRLCRNDLRLSGSDGTTHSLRTTELLTEAMGVVRVAAMSSVGRDRAMDVLRELHKQLEALPPDLGPQAAPRPNVHTSFAEPHFEPQQPLSPSRHPCAGVDSYTQDVTNQEASSIIPAQPYSIPVLISSQAPPRSRNKGGSVPIGVEVQIGAQGPKKCTQRCLKCGLKAGHNSATCPNDPKNTERYDRAKNPVKQKRGQPAGSGAMKFTRSNSRITRSTVVTKTQDDAEGHDVSGQEDIFYSSDE
ncbi:hypothetical protein PR202_gb00828 [Eleusine coracana subsp. coracana]|uniref:Ubiquitin-like protease family profile domain-containing protein n=1 Tax=Eleusine coracana subsp. coracana TaxID=191504 RepID=A0AAV5DSV7_ELECO|nr:hypothetical protein PR202_gb00828 [Eleusine coracana subsp. coracana]